MALNLYDLCGADPEVRFSPPCWLAKFALLHKGLTFETTPLRFSEKSNYPDPEYALLPVLDDHGVLIKDSMVIARHLDEKYPENPLFRSDGERAAHAFYQAFAGAHVFTSLAPMMFWRVAGAVDAEDAVFFREKREARLGVTLEEAAKGADLRPRLEGALKILAAPLADSDYFGGGSPNLTDYMIGGALMWQRSITPDVLYETPPALASWFDRILDLYNGYGRAAKRAAITG